MTKSRVSELVEVALAMRDWIDAVPSDTQLPAMPGFDRDWCDSVIDDFIGKVIWHSSSQELPEAGRRVLTISPVYEGNDRHQMQYRLMDAQFVRISTEVERWAYLEDLETL